MYMYDPSQFAFKFMFLENFQKPPSGLFVAARRLMIILVFLGSRDGTIWRRTLNCQATHDNSGVSGFQRWNCLAAHA